MAFTYNLQKGRVDGVLLSLSDGTKEQHHLQHFQEKALPVVFFDRVYESDDHVKITTNDYESGLAATDHLAAQECKKIAHLYLDKGLSISRNRMRGYLDGLRKNKLKPDKNIILGFPDDSEKAFREIKQMLLTEKPDGIFSSFEKLAMLVYKACEEEQIRIPEEVKIISFSNLEIASLLNPSLTTITQPAFEIGKKAAETLISIIDNNTGAGSDKHIVLNSCLIKRKSTSR